MDIKTLSLVVLVSGLSVQAATQKVKVLPPPTGVMELKFSELLESPVGARGLAVSEKARSLNGKRVRLLGHMVQHENSGPGRFLLTPIPVQLHDEHYGLADDLPPVTVFVSTASQTKEIIPYRPGLLLVTGVLSIGNHEEPDGRISIFRLELDPARRFPRNTTLPLVIKTGRTRLQR